MRNLLIEVLILISLQCSYWQTSIKTNTHKDTINGIYIPINLEDCFIQINSLLNDSIKSEIKNQTEDEFTTNSHFGLGMWMRNNWQLWGGSRLSKYFNQLGISHPDDMSGIILSSYYRNHTGMDINLDEQIEYYITYWKVNDEPTPKDYPKGVKKLELDTKLIYKRNNDNSHGLIHVQTNTKGDKRWIYDYYFGWTQITEQQLMELKNREQREETLKKLYNKD